MKRTDDDIARAYYVQRQAIAASCKAYDRGATWEALRLAAAVYTMVHDGGAIKSIFSQGEIKQFAYVATGPEITPEVMEKFDRYTPLIEFERNKLGKGKFVPLCKLHEKRGVFYQTRLLTFEEWWEKDIVAFDTKPAKTVMVLDLHGGRIPHKPNSKAARRAYERANLKVDEIEKEARDDGIAPGTKTKISRRQLVFALRNQEGGGHFDPEILNPNYIALLRTVYMFSYPTLNICKNLELAMMRQVAEELRLTLLANGAKSRDGDLPEVFLGVTKDGKCYPMSSLPTLLGDVETLSSKS